MHSEVCEAQRWNFELLDLRYIRLIWHSVLLLWMFESSSGVAVVMDGGSFFLWCVAEKERKDGEKRGMVGCYWSNIRERERRTSADVHSSVRRWFRLGKSSISHNSTSLLLAGYRGHVLLGKIHQPLVWDQNWILILMFEQYWFFTDWTSKWPNTAKYFAVRLLFLQYI